MTRAAADHRRQKVTPAVAAPRFSPDPAGARKNGGRGGVLAPPAPSEICAWLSVSALAGLVGFAAFGLSWIDHLAGFVIAYFAVREGREAWEGELVCDDDDDD